VVSAAEADAGVGNRTSLRVRYPETDRMRVAYHGHYFVWFELGRTELMRDLGCAYGALEDGRGIHFPVISAGATYRSPARYDDRLTVETRLSSVGAVRVRFDYRVLRELDGALLATGFTEHATVGADGRPVRMPADLRSRLESGETQ